jgi:hypothetical protein
MIPSGRRACKGSRHIRLAPPPLALRCSQLYAALCRTRPVPEDGDSRPRRLLRPLRQQPLPTTARTFRCSSSSSARAC